MNYSWDVFVSHASQDTEFASELVKALRERDLRVWFDQDNTPAGNSISGTVNQGLSKSEHFVVVLSSAFGKPRFATKELESAITLTAGTQRLIIPVLCDVDIEQVKQDFPLIGDLHAVDGQRGAADVAQEISESIRGRQHDAPARNTGTAFDFVVGIVKTEESSTALGCGTLVAPNRVVVCKSSVTGPVSVRAGGRDYAVTASAGDLGNDLALLTTAEPVEDVEPVALAAEVDEATYRGLQARHFALFEFSIDDGVRCSARIQGTLGPAWADGVLESFCLARRNTPAGLGSPVVMRTINGPVCIGFVAEPLDGAPWVRARAAAAVQGRFAELEVPYDEGKVATARHADPDVSAQWHGSSEFFGREDIFAEIEELLSSDQERGRWVVITGNPGMGKTAILLEFIRRENRAGRVVVREVIEPDQGASDDPAAIVHSLVEQIRHAYPVKVPEVSNEQLLERLLSSAANEYMSAGERLVLVIDGLDDAIGDADDEASLPNLLPLRLPAGVHLLISTRSRDDIPRKLRDEAGVELIPLKMRKDSGHHACQEFWEHRAREFDPPLGVELVESAIQKADGHLLHAQTLYLLFKDLEPEERRVELIPDSLSGILATIWERLPKEDDDLVNMALGVLCAAREPLTLGLIQTVIEDSSTERDLRRKLLRSAKPFLEQQPTADPRKSTFRIYHESVRKFLSDELGEAFLRRCHTRLAESLCAWPVQEDRLEEYALKHAVVHHLEAGDLESAARLCRRADFLARKCCLSGVASLEEDLRLLQEKAERMDDDVVEDVNDLLDVLRSFSHWLREYPRELTTILYNGLRASGLEPSQIVEFAADDPPLRLRRPVVMRGDEERVLSQHSGSIVACAIRPDGTYAISGSDDRTIAAWRLRTGELLHQLKHDAELVSCNFMDRGNKVLSACMKGVLKVWNFVSGRELISIETGEEIVVCIPDSKGNAIVGLGDGRIQAWNLARGSMLELAGHETRVTALALNPDGGRLVSGDARGTIRAWDLGGLAWGGTEASSGPHLVDLALDLPDAHDDEVTCCVVSPYHGEMIVSSSIDQTVRLHELANGEPVRVLEGHKAPVMSCAIASEGRLLSSSRDGELRVWGTDFSEVRTISAHDFPITTCVAATRGKRCRALTASEDMTLKVWDLDRSDARRSAVTCEGHGAAVAVCRADIGGSVVATGGEDARICLWRGEDESSFERHGLDTEQLISQIEIVDEGKTLLVATGDRLFVKDLDRSLDANPRRTFGKDRWDETPWTAAPDATNALFRSGERAVKQIDLGTTKPFKTRLPETTSTITCLCVSHDGNRVIVGQQSGRIEIFELASGERVHELDGQHKEAINVCMASWTGDRLVSSSVDGSICVWDLEAGEPLQYCELRPGLDGRQAWAISPYAKFLASGAELGALHLWSIDPLERIATVRGLNRFTAIAVGHDRIWAGDGIGNIWSLDAPIMGRGDVVLTPKGPPDSEPTTRRASRRARKG